MPGGLAVHRSQHRDLRRVAVDTDLRRDGRIHVAGSCGTHECAVPRHGGEHPRLDLSEVGADEHVAGFGAHRRSEIGGHVVQAGRGGHPTGGAVGRRPLAPQPTVGPHERVDPAVPERRGDALRLAPSEQRIHQRVITHSLKPPRPRVGHVDPGTPKHRLHLRRVAEVDRCSARRVAQHLVVAAPARSDRVGVGSRSRSHEPGDDPLRLIAVHRQPPGGELRAQQFGSRLRPGSGHSVGSLGRREMALLQGGGLRCQPRPARQAFRTLGPATVDPVGTQISVGTHGMLRVAHLRLGLGEQVERTGHRNRLERQLTQSGPHQRRIGAPTAGEQAVHDGNVPTRTDPQASVDEHRCGLDRPPHPSRAQDRLDARNYGGRIVDVDRELAAVWTREAQPDPACDRHADPHAAADTDTTKPLHSVAIAFHVQHPATPRCRSGAPDNNGRDTRRMPSGTAGSSARSAAVCLWRWRRSRRARGRGCWSHDRPTRRCDRAMGAAQSTQPASHIDCRPASYGAVTIGGRASDTPPLVANGPVRSTSVAEPIEMPSASICCATSRPTHSPTG